jgi:hypothetical protein
MELQPQQETKLQTIPQLIQRAVIEKMETELKGQVQAVISDYVWHAGPLMYENGIADVQYMLSFRFIHKNLNN